MRFKDSQLLPHELAMSKTLLADTEPESNAFGRYENYPLMRLHLTNVNSLPDLESVFKNCPLLCSVVINFSTSLSSKDVSKNRGLSVHAARRLGNYLKFSQCLLVISLSGANISDESLAALFPGLRCCMQLVELDLARNHISTEGAFLISHLLRKEYCLNILNLEQNDISRQGCFHISLSLASNTTLESLNLSLNPIGDNGAGDILRSLCLNFCLNHMAISCCNLTNATLPFVAILLSENDSLSHLDISGNPLGKDVDESKITLLLDALSSNHSMDNLDVRGCDFDPATAQQIISPFRKSHANDKLLPRLTNGPLERMGIAASTRK